MSKGPTGKTPRKISRETKSQVRFIPEYLHNCIAYYWSYARSYRTFQHEDLPRTAAIKKLNFAGEMIDAGRIAFRKMDGSFYDPKNAQERKIIKTMTIEMELDSMIHNLTSLNKQLDSAMQLIAWQRTHGNLDISLKPLKQWAMVLRKEIKWNTGYLQWLSKLAEKETKTPT